MDGGEEQGDHGKEEASFLVGDGGEEKRAGDCGEERESRWGEERVYCWEEEEGRAEEEGERGDEVLVVGMKAVEGEVGGAGVVEEGVERGEDGVGEEGGEGCGGAVEGRVCYYGNGGGEETGGDEGEDGKGSEVVSELSLEGAWVGGCLPAVEMWDEEETRKEYEGRESDPIEDAEGEQGTQY